MLRPGRKRTPLSWSRKVGRGFKWRVCCSAAMARGFVYLAAVVDWFSRRVLNWRLSITLDVSFCLEALEVKRMH